MKAKEEIIDGILSTNAGFNNADWIPLSQKELTDRLSSLESETKSLIEKHKAELEQARAEGYNRGAQNAGKII